MNALERLLAAAARLQQAANGNHSKQAALVMSETSAVIRGAVASIRRAAEGDAERAARRDHTRFTLIVGDEGG